MKITIDPELKKLIPPLAPEELAELERSILDEGCRDPLIVWTQNGKSILLDGHHRHAICRKHGIPFKTVSRSFASKDDARLYMIGVQKARRNLPKFALIELEMLREAILQRQAKENQRQSEGKGQKVSRIRETLHTDTELAKGAGVSRETVYRARFLRENADSWTIDRLRKGQISINEAYRRAKSLPDGTDAHNPTNPSSDAKPVVGNDTCALTAYVGDNAQLLKQVARLYFKQGAKIADVTYGRGAFWSEINLSAYDFHPSDIHTSAEAAYDFRHLPYGDNSFDVVVLDPPYAHNPGDMMVDDSYSNSHTTKRMYHADIIELYRGGMVEAKRILKRGGLLLVKCQDEVESSMQRWSHIEILGIATVELDMEDKDLFVLVRPFMPVVQHKRQQHARKNHSYLWVFAKK